MSQLGTDVHSLQWKHCIVERALSWNLCHADDLSKGRSSFHHEMDTVFTEPLNIVRQRLTQFLFNSLNIAMMYLLSPFYRTGSWGLAGWAKPSQIVLLRAFGWMTLFLSFAASASATTLLCVSVSVPLSLLYKLWPCPFLIGCPLSFIS